MMMMMVVVVVVMLNADADDDVRLFLARVVVSNCVHN